MVLECVGVGAGPVGLAARAALSRLDIDHVVLERARPGETWRYHHPLCASLFELDEPLAADSDSCDDALRKTSQLLFAADHI